MLLLCTVEGAGGLSDGLYLAVLAIWLDPPLYNRRAGGLFIVAAGKSRCRWREYKRMAAVLRAGFARKLRLQRIPRYCVVLLLVDRNGAIYRGVE